MYRRSRSWQLNTSTPFLYGKSYSSANINSHVSVISFICKLCSLSDPSAEFSEIIERMWELEDFLWCSPTYDTVLQGLVGNLNKRITIYTHKVL